MMKPPVITIIHIMIWHAIIPPTTLFDCPPVMSKISSYLNTKSDFSLHEFWNMPITAASMMLRNTKLTNTIVAVLSTV